MSFANKIASDIFNGKSSKESRKLPQYLLKKAIRQLDQLNASYQLEDMAIPPGNNLEALKGDRKGQFSVRINDQWRICFCWKNGSAHDVEIVDYHK